MTEEQEEGLLRHDEQVNEDYYDERSDADDDIEKGRIKFSHDRLLLNGSSQGSLYIPVMVDCCGTDPVKDSVMD